jgi:chromosome partitioning protein
MALGAFLPSRKGRTLRRGEDFRMYVVALASQKGGSGKTTLSGHLAVEAERVGAGPVALIDTDPQGSLSQWWNAREENAPSFATVGVLELGDALAHLRKVGVRLAVIDTPPAITGSISQVVAHADLVIVPTRPSPHDLRAVGATVDIAERHHKPVLFVMNGATARARITGEAAVALSQHGTVAPVTIHHRIDYAASMVDGRTVGEVVPKSASAKEISELWVYVQDRLARLMKDPKVAPDIRPQDFAVRPLSALDEEDLTEAAKLSARGASMEDVLGHVETLLRNTAPPAAPVFAESVERRDAPLNFQSPVRRVANPFGRRHTDAYGEVGGRK